MKSSMVIDYDFFLPLAGMEKFQVVGENSADVKVADNKLLVIRKDWSICLNCMRMRRKNNEK